MNLDKVEMRPAYVWDCDNCGRENFERGLVFEGSDEEMSELREEHGVQPWEEGNWMTYPDEVVCAERNLKRRRSMAEFRWRKG